VLCASSKEDSPNSLGPPPVPVHDQPHVANLPCLGEELVQVSLMRLQVDLPRTHKQAARIQS